MLRVLGPHIFKFQAVGTNVHQDHGIGQNSASQQFLGQRVGDQALNQTFDRSRAKGGIVSFFGQKGHGVVVKSTVMSCSFN